MKLTHFLLAIGSIVIASSCNNNIYIPNHQPVNLFEKKNELILSSSRSFGNGIGVELGYSLTNNIGVNSALNTFDISYSGENNSKLFSDYNWQNELVLFNKFDNNLYIGLNAGYGTAKFSANNPYYNINMKQKYLIPSVGYYFTPKFSMFLSVRRSLLQYQLHPLMSLDTEYDKQMFEQYFSIDNINNHKKYLSEPALTVSYLFQDIRLQAQMIRMMEDADDMIPYNFVLSVSVDLCKLYRNWKK